MAMIYNLQYQKMDTYQSVILTEAFIKYDIMDKIYNM